MKICQQDEYIFSDETDQYTRTVQEKLHAE